MARLSPFCLLFISLVVHTQVTFRTVVPQRLIAPGESFQVQYIIENAGEISNFSAPQFNGFRVVAGPNVYAGDRSSHRNIVFTLAALEKGHFKIYGATCGVNGKLIKSNDAFIEVASLEEPGESPYFLRTGEDPYEKIKQNLFLKLVLDKQSCFIGEPLVATFKLYSRLQSRSNVIKNPGFYGFSVYDMVDVNDQVLSEEKLNGHWFEVHTIRKVQLYPLQAGAFNIDPMEVANDVEFSTSIVNKQTEQEITEKMYGVSETKKETDVSDAEVYHVNLRTDPLIINVKSLPKKNAADTFAGAVGNFSIDAFVEKDSVNQNEENYLTVRINGSGNFQRVNAPVVSWPKAFEGFEPLLTDTLNKQLVPLTGQRSFRYAFSSSQPGVHVIPAIAFSFFNLRTRAYKTVVTRPLSVFVNVAQKEQTPLMNKPVVSASSKRWTWWISCAVLLLLIAIVFGARSILRKQDKIKKEKIQVEAAGSSVTLELILAPAQVSLESEDIIFYKELNKALWNYLHHKVGLSGSQMSKEMTRKVLLAKNVRPDLVDDLIEVIRQSEIGSYTGAQLNLSKTEVFQKAKTTLEAIEM